MKVCPLCIVAAAGISVVGLLALGGAGTRVKAPASTALPASINEAAFNVDSGHSSVVFRIKHMNVANFYGRFNTVSGSFSVDPAKPDAATALATIAKARRRALGRAFRTARRLASETPRAHVARLGAWTRIRS
mgnify:CR=1 FL=1